MWEYRKSTEYNLLVIHGQTLSMTPLTRVHIDWQTKLLPISFIVCYAWVRNTYLSISYISKSNMDIDHYHYHRASVQSVPPTPTTMILSLTKVEQLLRYKMPIMQQRWDLASCISLFSSSTRSPAVGSPLPSSNTNCIFPRIGWSVRRWRRSYWLRACASHGLVDWLIHGRHHPKESMVIITIVVDCVFYPLGFWRVQSQHCCMALERTTCSGTSQTISTNPMLSIKSMIPQRMNINRAFHCHYWHTIWSFG